MKDVQATLRRLDEEIVGHKQNIARHQVEIARLQDTRAVLMRLAEDDIAHAEAAKAERVGVLPGEHAKPQLIVRKIGSGDEEGSASQAAKRYGKTIHARANGSATAEKPKKRRKREASESGEMRAKIMKIMDTTPMSSREIGDFLGLPRDEKARKSMSNALYQLKVKGELIRDAEHRYVRPQ
jgi:hypothetical protein